jgi:hypothetical protein
VQNIIIFYKSIEFTCSFRSREYSRRLNYAAGEVLKSRECTNIYEGESNENRKNFFKFNLLNESGNIKNCNFTCGFVRV